MKNTEEGSSSGNGYRRPLSDLQLLVDRLRELRTVNRQQYEQVLQKLVVWLLEQRAGMPEEITDAELIIYLRLINNANFPNAYHNHLTFISHAINADWLGFAERVQQQKLDGALPLDITPEELAANLLYPIQPILRPGHPYLKALGARSTAEWKEQDSEARFQHLLGLAETGEIKGVLKSYAWGLRQAYRNKEQKRVYSKALAKNLNNKLMHAGISKDVFANSIGCADDRMDLEQMLKITNLSRKERIVFLGWLTGELPLPRQVIEKSKNRKYGQVRQFVDENDIPYKGLYELERRVLKKLKKVSIM